MIETIYSSDGDESGRTSKSQISFKMPKNIRQVGKSNTYRKIYVEDYVMTFIKQLPCGDFSKCKIAVLLGQCNVIENCRNIFISGAVEVHNTDISNDIVFTNDVWTAIYEDIKKFFVEAEIVGWYLGGPDYLLADEDKILKTHIDNFAGQDKILLTFDSLEKEEAFLSYENNKLCKQDGYYIYYEKNEEMQSYIIENKNPSSVEADYEDKVAKNIRTVIESKKGNEEESKNITKLMYAAGTLLAVIVLIVGAAMLRNYDQMRSMQNTLNYLSKNMEDFQSNFEDTDKSSENGEAEAAQSSKGDANSDMVQSSNEGADRAEDDNLHVEVVPGDVTPLPEEDSQSKDSDKDDKDGDTPISDKELAEDNKIETKPTKAAATPKPEKEESSKPAKKEINYYVVVEGDTLADISYKLYKTYTKVKTIMKLNDITDQDLIYAGQKLIVP